MIKYYAVLFSADRLFRSIVLLVTGAALNPRFLFNCSLDLPTARMHMAHHIQC